MEMGGPFLFQIPNPQIPKDMIVITNTDGVVNIHELQSSPPSHQLINISGAAGTFDTELISSTGGTDPDDLLVITHEVYGRIGNGFKAADFDTPSGPDLATIRPLVESLLTI